MARSLKEIAESIWECVIALEEFIQELQRHIQHLNSPITLTMPIGDAVGWAVITVLLLLPVAFTTFLFHNFKWNWTVYAVLTGTYFSLIVGIVVLVTVSTTVQAAAVGAVTGMGVDLIATATQKDGPKTMINTLADIVANIIVGTNEATKKTGLPNPAALPLAVGIWVFLGVLALLLLVSTLQEAKKASQNQQTQP